ncbi:MULTISPECIES: hypothetical protein [unclassified Paenibacillus]|uniref:hypothetical protein n=1 Tax=unclassified Paenibacillus TaxID=185978 RepID=UPI001AEB3190|nr:MULTISPECIES: hypothetical protein [unclassified Paenibacillus]MBP1155099.1 hypothetical protein [Paenibacillus sp. PvP091]MBP1169517.1 hypothetical protein [Paenibacillus sp. PvR098]MBP2440545.1 hypothetical protein [Paenibacillus sp. PvP052]
MKIHELSFLSLRILAVYLFYLGLTELVKVYYFGIPSWLGIDVFEFEFDASRLILLYTIPAGFLLSIGIILWASANKLSYIILARRKQEEQTLEFKYTYVMIISIVGLVIVVFSTVNLIKGVPNLWTNHLYVTSPIFKENVYIVIAESIKLIAGLCLFLRADVFWRVIANIQERNR